jgi:hypothetical protein
LGSQSETLSCHQRFAAATKILLMISSQKGNRRFQASRRMPQASFNQYGSSRKLVTVETRSW